MALHVQGCEGVEKTLEILRDEFQLSMKLSGEWIRVMMGTCSTGPLSPLSGCASLSDITPALVVHERELPLSRL